MGGAAGIAPYHAVRARGVSGQVAVPGSPAAGGAAVTVYLVGAGPGDPELLTVRAARLVASAAVLIHDRLVSPEVLAMAPADALRIDVGKAVGNVPVPQDAINALLVEHGRRTDRVVRLKGGDPFVFGRGGEEAEALISAGIAFEVVPGVTSAVAAPAAAGVPVTMRHRAAAFTVVTGHDDRSGLGVDWEAHAATGATLVVLMGAGRIGTIAERLIAGGRDPATPVVAVRWATTPQQEELRTTLAEVGDAELRPPCTIVIGDVAALDLSGRASLSHPPSEPS
jgi:uroporphyrin-III C-methyltransferase